MTPGEVPDTFVIVGLPVTLIVSGIVSLLLWLALRSPPPPDEDSEGGGGAEPPPRPLPDRGPRPRHARADRGFPGRHPKAYRRTRSRLLR